MYNLYIEGKGHFQLISKEDNGREDYFNKWDSDSFLVAVGDEVELHILKNDAIIAPNGITIEKVKTRKLVEASILKAGKDYIITRDNLFSTKSIRSECTCLMY